MLTWPHPVTVTAKFHFGFHLSFSPLKVKHDLLLASVVV